MGGITLSSLPLNAATDLGHPGAQHYRKNSFPSKTRMGPAQHPAREDSAAGQILVLALSNGGLVAQKGSPGLPLYHQHRVPAFRSPQSTSGGLV